MSSKKDRMAPGLLLPLGALAAGFGLASSAALAQAQPAEEAKKPVVENALPVVRAKASAERAGKDDYQAIETRIGKGRQELRDVPQSITVVTERLIDDRNLDTMKEVLKNTAGITFMAAEGGEEDIRLRGFSLQATGDIFMDGMRDPAFYERDTFFVDRVELMRGSASMLFGRGSTGGAVNMVTKVPRLINENQIDVELSSHSGLRTVGDFNVKMGDSAALRVGAMLTRADNDGTGASQDKAGIAGTYRFGIGEVDEFSVGLYHLENHNGMNYGMPWVRPTATSPVGDTTLLPLDPTAYYGMASDRNDGHVSQLTATHTHRFSATDELQTRVRVADYGRDQRAGTVRFGGATTQPDRTAVTLATFGPNTVITRGTQNKIQDMQTLSVQSDYTGKFKAWGLRHAVQAGADFSQEEKQVFAARSAAQGGVNLTKPNTSIGRPNDGAWIDENSRVLRTASEYTSRGFGLYAQDLIEFAPQWKLLLGLRYDKLKGDYDTLTIPGTAAGPETKTSYRMKVSEISKRLGLMFQPNERMSFHASAATSFNTSGDAYSLGADNQNIPPEQSINMELGAKIDSNDGKLSTRFALFRSTKLHERNTDPLVNLITLSGKRHVAGFEMDVMGRPAPGWELYASYTFIPVANIDIGVAGSEGQGTRPSLTPRHSGTAWATYQLTPKLRVGGGLNARSGQSPNRNPGWYAPKFITADLMAEYAVIAERLTFRANLSNVANKLYADSLYSGHYIPGAGRIFALTGTYKF
ncbi:TonB-dependent receptor [Roseateles toxinivorans]|uniref:Catecholate siderophore receptor n=1 Tax=Roseateles toxinivorans TaxID=270368 RepID=A0A4R6QR80_9BURK|nr:TonB-dependent siderophore receptor [Roseateles toxinivorans]TDP73082.1 catecholate siderophore receptor [Roseateles toxinivorans]